MFVNFNCHFQQTTITKDLDNLPINYALLQLVTTASDNNNVEPEILPAIIESLTSDELECYKLAKSCIEELALYLKPNGSIAGLFSRPMQRKLVTLINCQLMEDEGRARSMRAARSLGERTVTELILQHQNPQQLSANLWAAVRARGCQFLGPAMQEEVLKLVLLALEDGVSLCRKVLVMFVVQRLEPSFPQASKTSIGHVVQLLYRASCFKVSKRDGDSSLMQLKEEFRTYKNLRKEHDAQIVQIATEAGLRIAPDQWSALLYGDPNHKSDMQSLIDKQQSPQSFGQSVQELMIALQRTSDPANLSALRIHLKNLSDIDASSDSNVIPTWQECSDAINAVKDVVNGLVDFVQNHSSRKSQDACHLPHTTRYKISFCRDLSIRGNCPRGNNCTFAHSDDELERYRSKMKKNPVRQHIKDPSSFTSINNGPNPKVNITHPPYANSNEANLRFNKSMPYRSENSLNHTPAKTSQHLMPIYPTGSSSSTPNLSQSQLSPKMMAQSMASQIGNRFTFNNFHQMNRPPPLSVPAVSQQQQQQQYFMKTSPSGYSPEYKKQFSPYHNSSPMPINQSQTGSNGFFPVTRPMFRNEDYSNNNGPTGERAEHKFPMNWRSGNGQIDKMKKSPSHMMMKGTNEAHQTSPVNRNQPSEMDMNRMYRNKTSDEIDAATLANMWMAGKTQQTPPVFQFDTSQAKDNFTRSDSILTSNTDDEISFDNMSLTGKYGPIGIKTNQQLENARARQWSGLQSMMKRFDGNFNGSGDGSVKSGSSFGGNRSGFSSNGNNNRAQKLNYLNIPIGDMSVSKMKSQDNPVSDYNLMFPGPDVKSTYSADTPRQLLDRSNAKLERWRFRSLRRVAQHERYVHKESVGNDKRISLPAKKNPTRQTKNSSRQKLKIS